MSRAPGYCDHCCTRRCKSVDLLQLHLTNLCDGRHRTMGAPGIGNCPARWHRMSSSSMLLPRECFVCGDSQLRLTLLSKLLLLGSHPTNVCCRCGRGHIFIAPTGRRVFTSYCAEANAANAAAKLDTIGKSQSIVEAASSVVRTSFSRFARNTGAG